jgi:Tfp pilus assembly PilM family ATPase/Tfp pilus assembly protein PilN
VINLNLQTTTAIYVGVNNVYLAQLKRTIFGPFLVTFGKVAIECPIPVVRPELSNKRIQAITQSIKKLFQDNKIETKKVVMAIAGKDVLIRYFRMPRLRKSEWATAVKFEARKYVPFKIEELFWDFHVVLPRGKTDKDKMDVTFVAIKKEIAQQYLSILENMSLQTLVLEPAPFSLVRFLALGDQLAKDKATAIVDVDYGMADINIVKNKVCYLTRDVSLSLKEDVLFDNLLNEIRLSVDYYQKQFPDEQIGKVLLCGEVDFKNWGRDLTQALKVTVKKAEATYAIKIQEALPPLSMAVAIGLALHNFTNVAPKINLCRTHAAKPKVEITKESFDFTPAVRQVALQAIILSCIGLLILFFTMNQRLVQQRKELERIISLRPKIRLAIATYSYEGIEKVKKELERKLSFLRFIIDKRIFWTDKFSALPKIIPSGAWLTNLSLSERIVDNDKLRRSLTIKGVAYHDDPVQEIGIITKFISSLQENKEFSQGFAEIKLDSMSSAELKEKLVKNFIVSCSGK